MRRGIRSGTAGGADSDSPRTYGEVIPKPVHDNGHTYPDGLILSTKQIEHLPKVSRDGKCRGEMVDPPRPARTQSHLSHLGIRPLNGHVREDQLVTCFYRTRTIFELFSNYFRTIFELFSNYFRTIFELFYMSIALEDALNSVANSFMDTILDKYPLQLRGFVSGANAGVSSVAILSFVNARGLKTYEVSLVIAPSKRYETPRWTEDPELRRLADEVLNSINWALTRSGHATANTPRRLDFLTGGRWYSIGIEFRRIR
ncbi:MAG: hypothetical protein ACYCOU_03075 [Sulfobacillus sp.]